MFDHPFADLKFLGWDYSVGPKPSLPEQKGIIFEDSEGPFLIPLKPGKRDKLGMPELVPGSVKEKDWCFFDGARHVLKMPTQTDDALLGEQKIISDELRHKINLVNRFQNLSSYSQKQNEEFFNALETTGIALVPVYRVNTAWSFGDGAYGEYLIVKTDTGWREAFASFSYENIHKGAKGDTYTQLWLGLSGFSQKRPPHFHHDTKLTKLTSDVEQAIIHYFANQTFFSQLAANKRPISFIFGDTHSPRREFKVAALLATKSGPGVIVSRGPATFENGYMGSHSIFVPMQVQAPTDGKKSFELRMGNAEEVSLNREGVIIAAKPLSEPQPIEPALRKFFEAPEFSSSTTLNVSIKDGPG